MQQLTSGAAIEPRPEAARAEPVLDVRRLAVEFNGDRGVVTAVHDVSFTVAPGETLALVGESGSGKSVTSLAVMRLTPPPPRALIYGSVLMRGRDGAVRDLLTLGAEAMRAVRGNEISMIFQEPMTSLNPVHRVGDQIAEAVMYHRRVDRRAAWRRAEELLDRVGIPEPRRRLDAYPHHLSGGMRQRIMIAMALACDPTVLIADEPTTALDVTVQAQILELLKELQRESGMAIVFITHNLGVVAEIADRVMVMYAGRIVEHGDAVPVLTEPRMPYTRGLLRSVPSMDWRSFGSGPLDAVPGSVPDPNHLPPGCAFNPRCGFAEPGLCDDAVPVLEAVTAGGAVAAGEEHFVRCHRWRAVATEGARPA